MTTEFCVKLKTKWSLHYEIYSLHLNTDRMPNQDHRFNNQLSIDIKIFQMYTFLCRLCVLKSLLYSYNSPNFLRMWMQNYKIWFSASSGKETQNIIYNEASSYLQANNKAFIIHAEAGWVGVKWAMGYNKSRAEWKPTYKILNRNRKRWKFHTAAELLERLPIQ